MPAFLKTRPLTLCKQSSLSLDTKKPADRSQFGAIDRMADTKLVVEQELARVQNGPENIFQTGLRIRRFGDHGRQLC